MRVVDANVLLYAVNRDSAHHASARAWLDAALSADEQVGFSWTVILAFVRLATHPAVFPSPLSAADALAVIVEWLEAPASVLVEPTTRHLPVLSGLLAATGTGANLVNDAHLAALAIEHGASLVSYDHDFGRFSGLTWDRPDRA